jgi:hypothetical protein
MTPDTITCLFKEAHDAFPPLKGKLSDNDLLAIQETLLPLLMVIPYNQLNRVHSLTAILTKAVKFEADLGAYLYARLVSHSTTRQLLMTPRQAFAFVRRLPTNPNLITMPVTRQLNKVCPSFSATLLMRFGTKTSIMLTPST